MHTATDQILEDILAAVAFDAGDRRRLADLHARVAPELAEIADQLYHQLLAHPGTAAVLRDPAQLARLHATMVDWMASGLLGPYDRPFYDKRSRIGRRHVEIGLPQQYMFTAMNVLRREYDIRIARLYGPDEAVLVARSADKLLDVELALMLRHYQLDSEERLVARAEAAQSERVLAIQTLSAGLAHEVRNPLNAGKLQLELLERRLRKVSEDPQLLEPIEQAQHEIDRLTRMLSAFLAFARPVPLALGDHDVAAVIREIVDAARPRAHARGAAIELDGVASLISHVDAEKLRQIVHNLVNNAIEAVAPGGRVAVTVGGDAEHIQLTVEDDGPGIPEVVQRRIYEPFFSTKPASPGLGLSIVHSAVTLHGGTVSIESGAGRTRFLVSLPRQAAPASS